MELSKPDTDQFGVRRISFAFAFDVDGVLVKGDKPIPGARETIKMLQEKHVPFILLTNGGGKTEEAHVASIGERLGVEVSKAQFIQSHSPYRELVPEYQDKNILVLGGYNNDIKNIATHYGFKKVITASDLQQYFQHIHPFPEMTEPKHKEIAEIPRGTLKHMLQREIAAILVFSSPRDWCGDLQLIIDILLSRGVGNTSLPDNGFIQDGQPKLYFCNPDLEWTTQHKFPRFAQGAFTSALEGVWQALTDGQVELKYSTIGKPTQKTFEYGETTLQEYNNRLNRENGTNNYIKTVYMIGDNPNSDIKGCNNYISPFGTNWKSVLVETGVYAAGSPPTHIPTHFACTCKDAVQWALLQEGHATGG
ncbi:HAD-like domain-containing protein [Ustulina deusta]|nr:HAD-like domain-containing protein [Ustulina deusta]